MGRSWNNFVLLMWKNWVLIKRHPVTNLATIIVPLLIGSIPVLLRFTGEPESYDDHIYKPFEVCSLPSFSMNFQKYIQLTATYYSIPTRILYAPQGDQQDKIMKDVEAQYTFPDFQLTVEGYNSQQEMEVAYRKNTSDVAFGVHLNIKSSGDIDVSIRYPSELYSNPSKTWQTNLMYPEFILAGPRSQDNNTGATPNYYMETFLCTQEAISKAIVKLKDETITPPSVQLQRFPYPGWISDPLLEYLTSIFSMMLVFAFIMPVSNITKSIAVEKESQIKEAMKIMGLSNWLHWTAWFVRSFIMTFIVCVLLVIFYKVDLSNGPLLKYADPSLLLISIVLMITPLITLGFFISVCFSKANMASLVGLGVCFLLYLPYSFFGVKTGVSAVSKIFMSLFSNSAMGFGLSIIVNFEGTAEGAKWSNLFSTPTPDDNLSLGVVLLMLILDLFLYLGLALYIENVFPGQYGNPQPWNYLFKKSYWKGTVGTIDDFNAEDVVNNEFERQPDHLKPGIQIKNLKKVYNKVAAVQDLNLKMYENQITVLLGHNGAGKTTTMSILTGMIRPTGGTALINGHDIRTDVAGARSSLGFCPQHNIIFDEMTISEHLYFFSKLKGMNSNEIPAEIDRYISLLELEPKRHARASSLSGGMKRKLCVAIALCGNTKVVMLDEPTAGVDPSARRALWEFLQTQKEGRTILLSTHFMDEADLLGDRIAIMAKGNLQCCGSSFFLKKRYGAGYYLILDKNDNCQTDNVTRLLQRYIPDIRIMGNAGSELSYCLSEKYSKTFETMLTDLEANMDTLGVRSYGISLTTLEEVFLKVGADPKNEEDEEHHTDMTSITLNTNYTTKKVTGAKLIANQIHAMTLKKVLCTIRSWKVTLYQFVMPILLAVIVMTSIKSEGIGNELPSRKLSLDMFGSSKTLVQGSSKFSPNYQGDDSDLVQVTDISEEALKIRRRDINDFRFHYLVGATFTDDNSIIAWFNNDALHTPGIASAMAWQAVIKNLAAISVTFTNQPFPYKADTILDSSDPTQGVGMSVGNTASMAMLIASSVFAIFTIRDRVSKSKHLQFVSGVKVYIYWLNALVYDFLVFLVIILLTIMTLMLFRVDGYSTATDFGLLFTQFTLYGFAALPLIYYISFYLSIPINGYVYLSGSFMILGTVGYIVINVIIKIAIEKENIADALEWLFMFIPPFTLMGAVIDSYTIYSTKKVCEDYSQLPLCQTFDDNYFRFDSPGIGRAIMYFILTGVIMTAMLLLRDYKVFSRITYIIRQNFFKKSPTAIDDEDKDVQEERNKIRLKSESELREKYSFVMKDVTKYYGNFLAVNGVCLAAKGNECFGLLGINGAGKTTTFKMMTGDVKMSFGEAWVNGMSIKTQLNQVQKYIGYCPQFDALLDDLTARETIKMFALIRGIPLNEINALAEELAVNFDFKRHLDKEVRALSGGNKRKLSTAISLIGDPPILFLDEPTTGMDPATKRYLWNALCKIRDAGKLIILTSHSMEECEALCTRLAIMVNGSFKCLGSIQHLKNKFARGYTLSLKVRKKADSQGLEHSDTDKVEHYIAVNFPGSVLREKHQELIVYFVPGGILPCSKMFGILERAKRNADLNIEDYLLGQSNLEQVFLQFTKHQNADTKEQKK